MILRLSTVHMLKKYTLCIFTFLSVYFYICVNILVNILRYSPILTSEGSKIGGVHGIACEMESRIIYC